MALLLFALYPGVILGSHTFFYQDYGLFTYPVVHYTRECFRRGELPLWNPLIQCGVPFLAQWNTSVCYPLSLVYALLPLPWALNVFGLGHLVFAGWGMYRLARVWTGSRLAASLAGLAFGLNGLALNCLLWTSNLAALSWLPWVLLAAERAWQQGGRRALALAALAGGMQMLTGSPEFILLTWLLVAGLWLHQWVGRRVPRPTGLGRFAAVVVLVTGLAAVQLLPFIQLLAHSDRSLSSPGGTEFWPLPAWGWANLIVPQFRATQSLLATYHLAGQYWTKSYYLGVGVLALALLGAGRARPWPARWLAGAGLLGLVLALGRSGGLFSGLEAAVPWIGVMRYPVKFIALTVFAVPLLAACGLQALESTPPAERRRAAGLLGGIGLGLAVLAAGILWVAHRFPRPAESWPVTGQDGAVRLAMLAGQLGCVCAGLFAHRGRTRAWLGAAVLVLVGFDLTSAALRLHPTVDRRAFGPLELNLPSRPRLGESRALVSREAAAFLERAGTTNPLAYCITLRGALFKNGNLLENIPKVDGFCSLRLQPVAALIRALDDSILLDSPLANFLGVTCINEPGNVFAWAARAGALPWITAGQRPVFCDEEEARRAVTASDFNPRQVVYLPLDAGRHVRATAVAQARILSPQWSAHRVRFTVHTPEPAVVVIAQSFYPNWRASVDGQAVSLWRANYAFQALEVPAGEHQVTLVYRDRPFLVGSCLSALSLAICLVLLCGQPRQGRGPHRRKPPAAPAL